MKVSISDPPISDGCVHVIFIPSLTLSAFTSVGLPGISGTGVGVGIGVAVGLGVGVGKLDMTIGVGRGIGTGVGTAILGA